MLEGINGNNDINFLRNLGADNQTGNRALYQTQGLTIDQQQNAQENGRVAGQGSDGRENNLGVVEGDNNKQEDSSAVKENAQPKNEGQLTEEEQKELEELKATDRKVRQHEMAHLSASQGIAVSGANFQYQRGPDGVNYAVGGDVKIDASKEDDPEKTLDKARKIVAAAMAPADPSAQDRSVAASARQMEAQARIEMAREQQEEAKETNESPDPNQPSTIDNTKEKSTETAGAINQENTNPIETNRAERGIESYIKNQNFAPSSPLMPEFESLASNPAVPNARVSLFQPGAYLDMVA